MNRYCHKKLDVPLYSIATESQGLISEAQYTYGSQMTIDIKALRYGKPYLC